jgi:two-component system chemotaxis response regulator CheB
MHTSNPTDDTELLYELAEKLTGTCQDGKFRHQVIVTNVRRRMHVVGAGTIPDYLAFASEDDGEFQHLISALTIHTTSWFREAPHFDALERDLLKEGSALSRRRYRALSAACSTGEEAYTLALVLESIRERFPGFEYEISGSDVDLVSVKRSANALYSVDAIKQIPHRFHRFLLKGQGKHEGQFSLSKEIRKRCSFKTNNLKEFQSPQGLQYDFVLCRNVLIYFSPADVDTIVKKLLSIVTPSGVLCVGHSEALDHTKYQLRPLGNARYSPFPKGGQTSTTNGEITVLVVDDSATVRASLLKLLSRSKLKATAVASADEATKFLQLNQVDLITLDLHMPGVSGQTWLRSQRAAGMRTPVSIISGASPAEAIEVLGALESGAQDYIDKASIQGNGEDIVERLTALGQQYRTIQSKGANRSAPRREEKPFKIVRPELIMIGASTGGTECLTRMLRNMPRDCPPLLVTQHISAAFSEPFAKRLAQSCGLTLGDPKDGVKLECGTLYMALGDYHLGVTERKGDVVLKISAEGPINRHRPSVDFLFQSASTVKTSKIFAAILTGMGADGAHGLQALHLKGCMTLAQDEDSCVVFGMPKEAIKLGAARFIGAPEEIREQLDKSLSK